MNHSNGEIFVAFPFALMCCGGIFALAMFALWLWALIDCVRRDFPGPNDKVMWVLIIVLLNWIGALVYLIVGRSQGAPTDPKPPSDIH